LTGLQTLAWDEIGCRRADLLISLLIPKGSKALPMQRLSVNGINRVRSRGVAATELAIILPLLVTIVFGCVDFGRFAYSYISVTNAARAAADFAATHTYTTGTETAWRNETRQAAIDEMSQMLNFNATDVTVPNPVVTNETGQSNGLKRVRVTVSYPFRTVVTWPAIPSQTNLSRTVEMRVIR
jgi:Flp pilus assembly protein TadG